MGSRQEDWDWNRKFLPGAMPEESPIARTIQMPPPGAKKDEELAKLVEVAIAQCWISGRHPTKETTVIRITKQDARRIVRALRRKHPETE
jgi:hypothetical protein